MDTFVSSTELFLKGSKYVTGCLLHLIIKDSSTQGNLTSECFTTEMCSPKAKAPPPTNPRPLPQLHAHPSSLKPYYGQVGGHQRQAVYSLATDLMITTGRFPGTDRADLFVHIPLGQCKKPVLLRSTSWRDRTGLKMIKPCF